MALSNYETLLTNADSVSHSFLMLDHSLNEFSATELIKVKARRDAKWQIMYD